MSEAEDATQEVLDLLELEEILDRFRADAIVTLGHAASNKIRRVIQKLLCVFEDDDFEDAGGCCIREAVFIAHERIGPQAVPILIETLRSDDEPSANAAAWILGHFSDPEYPAEPIEALQEAAKSSIRALLDTFVTGRPRVRESCVIVVGEMARDFDGVTKSPNSSLKNSAEDRRATAEAALRVILKGGVRIEE